MRAIFVTAALTLLLAGCSSTEKEMLDEVRSYLKDPSSAEFSQVHVKKTERGTRYVMCGMLNAKNSFGGYVGAEPFTAIKVDATGKITVKLDSADCETALSDAKFSETFEYAKELLGHQ